MLGASVAVMGFRGDPEGHNFCCETGVQEDFSIPSCSDEGLCSGGGLEGQSGQWVARSTGRASHGEQ